MTLPQKALRLFLYSVHTNKKEHWIQRCLAQFFKENLFGPIEDEPWVMSIVDKRLRGIIRGVGREPLLITIPSKRCFYNGFSLSRFYSHLQRTFSVIETYENLLATSSEYISVISADIIMENTTIKIDDLIVIPFLTSKSFVLFAYAFTEDRYKNIVSLPKGVEIKRYIFSRWAKLK